MSPEFVQITFNGKRFSLTKEEARFVAEHLRTALTTPGTSLSFNRQPQAANEQLITLERGQGMAEMDAAYTPAEFLTDC